VNGYVTFVMEGRELAGRLDEVREVVRATGVEPLTGARAPVTGLLVLRGSPVPVVDLRSAADAGEAGDVLVLQTGDGVLGLAVDRVLAVLGPDELAPVAGRGSGLPAYVLEVRRSATGAPVFVVSLLALAGLVPA
jgi:chemotaxis signal transduction protein